MLIATITALLIVFGGGGSAMYTVLDLIGAAGDAIEDRVEDEALREEMLAVTKQMELDTKRFVGEIQEHRQKILQLDRTPDATREQYLMAFRSMDADWIAVEESLVDGILDLKGRVSHEKWLVIRAEMKNALE